MTGLNYYNQMGVLMEAVWNPEPQSMIGINTETGTTNINEVYYA